MKTAEERIEAIKTLLKSPPKRDDEKAFFEWAKKLRNHIESLYGRAKQAVIDKAMNGRD